MDNTLDLVQKIDTVIGVQEVEGSQSTQNTQGIIGNIDQLIEYEKCDNSVSCTDSKMTSEMQGEISVNQSHVEMDKESTVSQSDEPGASTNVKYETDLCRTDTSTAIKTNNLTETTDIYLHQQMYSVDDSDIVQDSRSNKDHSEIAGTKVQTDNVEFSENLESCEGPDAKRQRLSGDEASKTIISNNNTESQNHVSVITQSTCSSHAEEPCLYSRKPKQVACVRSEFDADNYLRGCKWAPDGTCILATANDNHLRIYNLPESVFQENEENIVEMTAIVKVREVDTIYDYCWYPAMSSSKPETSCFVSTCRDSPVHMWDAFNGELKCSYRPYNHLDEVAITHSLAFSIDGSKLYCGTNKMIRVFDTARPGRDCQSRPTLNKAGGQPGIISCIAPSPQGGGLYAAGSYARGIALYHEPAGDMVCVFEGQQGGVTHIAFSPDGTKLYSGGRKDPEILCWDLRRPGQILFVAHRQVETNQRIFFDQDSTGRFLFSGNHNGNISVWDTNQSPVQKSLDTDFVLDPIVSFPAHCDTVNGVSFHPELPLLTSCSGQRHFPELGDSDDSEEQTDDTTDNVNSIDNSLILWSYCDKSSN